MAGPRVFVSSVVEGFESYRKAAREGIEAAGGEPVLVNEDFPSMPTSSRNACLDAVASSDIYLAIIGERAGWKAPSGKPVVEEEFEEARNRDSPVLLFLVDGDREEEARRLTDRLSDYVDGYFRVQVRGPEELRDEVERSLNRIIDDSDGGSSDVQRVQTAVSEPYDLAGRPSLRVALVPERQEEVVGPTTLESKEFRYHVYRLAHSFEVDLLEYEQPKTHSLTPNSLVVTQRSAGQQRRGAENVRVEVGEKGWIIVDGSVTGNDQGGVGAGMAIVSADLESVAEKALAFAEAFYDWGDEYGRYQRFSYNAVLANPGPQEIVDERDPSSQSFSAQPLKRDQVLAYTSPRSISRNTLRDSDEEVERLVTRIRRRRESGIQ